MKKLLKWLRQRRLWAALVSGGLFVLGMFGVLQNLDAETLTNLLVEVGKAAAALITAVLALHSYLKPKKNGGVSE